MAQAVGAEGQQRGRQSVLGHHRQGVGAVVLHRQAGQGQRQGELVGEVAGVAIQGDPLQPFAMATAQLVDALAQAAVEPLLGQIAQVGRQPDRPPAARAGAHLRSPPRASTRASPCSTPGSRIGSGA